LFPLSESLNNLSRGLFVGASIFITISAVEQLLVVFFDAFDTLEERQYENFRRNLSKGTSIVFYSIGAIFVLDNMGFNMSSIVAGFGITGMAIALASQSVLGDTIASLALFFDKPFQVGQPVTILGHSGVIEFIGFKTTRLRSNNGELVIFPNSAVSSAVIQNFVQDNSNQLTTISINNNTSHEILENLPKEIEKALADAKEFKFAEAYFKGFGASSFDFEVRYQVHSTAPPFVRHALGLVNTRLHAALKQLNIQPPIPTQKIIRLEG